MDTLVGCEQITIVDLAKIEHKKLPPVPSPEMLKICDDINTALTNRGLVFLVNHGISDQEMKNAFLLLDQFLALPFEVKDTYKSNGIRNVHGYLAQNTEKFLNKTKKEVRESFNITNFDRKLPDKEVPGFSECVKSLFEKLTEVTNIFLQLLAVGLGLSPDYLLKYHEGILNRSINTSILRLIFYPPVEQDPNDKVIRIEEHTDYGTCTLLMQDSEGGLEVKGNDGEWRRVGYIPGGILINTSDLLEVWTSGGYKAAVHRVVVPLEKHIRTRARHSMAFFVHPDATTVIKPIRPCPGYEREYIAKDHILGRINESDTTKEEVCHQSG